MYETSKILIFTDVSSVSQRSRCSLAVMKESRDVSGQHSITQARITSGCKSLCCCVSFGQAGTDKKTIFSTQT